MTQKYTDVFLGFCRSAESLKSVDGKLSDPQMTQKFTDVFSGFCRSAKSAQSADEKLCDPQKLFTK
jgi:hypothetical protein